MDKNIIAAAKQIKEQVQIETKVGIILGSGLGKLIDEFEEAVTIKFEDIPHFPVSSVPGHQGMVVGGRLANCGIVALSGRVHYYEGYSMQEVCFPTSVMAELGIQNLIVSNAAGAVNESYSPGDIIVIRDHINMMGDNPLKGAPNFVDLTHAYDKNLRGLAHDTAKELGMELPEGVYLAVTGPCYETPAEIRSFRNLGADTVGMSTIPEVIMANSLGVRVLGLSMVTNMAAGITGIPLSHEEVLETTTRAADKFKSLVRGIVHRLA
jgi:purine-nucleoside phosphorylase